MSADGPEQRERSPLAESIFEMAKLNMESYRNAYQAGYDAGHHQGYIDAMKKAQEMVKAGMVAEQEVLP
jgi:flagellar biosynthesis/type III secretory pathway protein FliH